MKHKRSHCRPDINTSALLQSSLQKAKASRQTAKADAPCASRKELNPCRSYKPSPWSHNPRRQASSLHSPFYAPDAEHTSSPKPYASLSPSGSRQQRLSQLLTTVFSSIAKVCFFGYLNSCFS